VPGPRAGDAPVRHGVVPFADGRLMLLLALSALPEFDIAKFRKYAT
jgi:hypothetical protein